MKTMVTQFFTEGKQAMNLKRSEGNSDGIRSLRKRVLSLILSAVILAGTAGAGILPGQALLEQPAEAAAATKVVVLDPGHGGWEKGATYHGMEEKTLNLKIARYCQAALLRYANVRVVMTRSSDTTVSKYRDNRDREARAKIAKNNNADLFVCLHNNAFGEGESKKTNGARVYYQNGSFYSSVGDASRRLASIMVRKVAACGVANGGARVRHSDDKGRRDPKGNKGDYYGVLYHCKKFKIPAVIVEHAFMTNAGDAAKLRKESFLKQLGEADAAAIAEYLGLKKKTVTVKVPAAKKAAATASKAGWRTVSGKKYYYNAAGKKVTGWQTIGGRKYFFRKKDGRMMTGWQKINKKKYYFSKSDGHMLTGWQKIGGKKYFLSRSDGHMLTGKQKIDGRRYKFSSKGVLKKTYK